MLKTLFHKLLEMKILILLLTFSLTNYSVTKTNIEKERSLLKTEYLMFIPPLFFICLNLKQIKAIISISKRIITDPGTFNL